MKVSEIKIIRAASIFCFLIAFWMTAVTAAAQQNSKVEEIIIVFKTHFDIGYTHLASDAINSYRTSMIDDALNSIEKMPADQQFVWTLPGWPLTQILWEGQDPNRRLRVEEAIRSGRIAWHALPYTVETDGLDMESLARGFVFSDNLSRKYGKPLSVTGKMTDVPQHSWFLATLLSHAGVRFFHIGTNNQCMPPDVPELFFWEGPDGSRVLVNIGKQRYGSGLLPPKEWPFKTWFAMQMTGDNEGPPSSADVTRMIKTVNDSLPGVKVRLGTIDDFYSSLSKEDLSKVPVIRGDMPDTWIHGIGSMPMETKLAHNIRPQLVAWEILETILNQHQLKQESEKINIAEAYENSLMYGEHTWGSQTEGIPDSYWGDTLKKAIAEYKKHGKPEKLIKPSLPFFEESFDQHRRYIWKTRDLVESGISGDMKILAENVALSGPRVVVFNSLPWKRDAVVTVNGKPFLAKDLPASGYKTFPLPAKSVKSAGSAVQSTEISLESPYFKLAIDPAKGGITSLIDKRTNRELVEKDAVLGQYLFEQYSANEVFDYIGEYDQNPQWGRARTRGVYRGAPVTEQSMMNSGQQMGKPHMPLDVKYSANYADNGTVMVERDEVGQTAVLSIASIR
jgi:alpha-mannosidase